MLELRSHRHRLEGFFEHRLSICGKDLVADMSGALYWPGERMLLVADMHLEKGSAAARRGHFLPPYDTRSTLGRLAEAIERFEPETVVSLGDSLHDRGAAERMSEDDLDLLRSLQEGRNWRWITGNHDPELPDLLGGEVCDGMEVGGVWLRHAPLPGRITHEIAGHLHPAARVSLYGYSIRRPCFVSNGLRLLMPAFGTYTGGLNILKPEIYDLFGSEGLSVQMLGQDGIYALATRQLQDD
ncbi:MAG: ligase-associated DNA damage response endonuclease PdeM [Hyphomicrobiaceae bacterium]|nr:ligase-associated DNA damage response endonuclease PdeM [Hyphomicrobiaceae bacterium]